MTLGEFRELTKEMSDNIVLAIEDGYEGETGFFTEIDEVEVMSSEEGVSVLCMFMGDEEENEDCTYPFSDN